MHVHNQSLVLKYIVEISSLSAEEPADNLGASLFSLGSGIQSEPMTWHKAACRQTVQHYSRCCIHDYLVKARGWH